MSGNTQKSQQFTTVSENLQRNGNGVYFGKLKVGKKRIRRSLETSDREIAKRKLKAFLEEERRIGASDNRDLLFEDVTASWLESLKGSTSKVSSQTRREKMVEAVTPYFKGLKFRDIKYDDVERWQIARSKKVMPRTFNFELYHLRSIFDYAIKKEICLNNIAAGFKRRKTTTEVAREDIPTMEQFSILIKHLSTRRVAPKPGGGRDIIEFMAYTGTRVQEAAQVLLRDINFKDETILITGGEVGTKNYKSRIIPLFENAKAVIERVLQGRPDLMSDDKIFHISTTNYMMREAAKEIGLPKFHNHSMRHFFVTQCMELNTPIHFLASWVGHSDGGALLLKTYTHIRKDTAKLEAAKIKFSAQNHS